MSQSESIAQERWLPVPAHEGYYEVSDHGRVRSVDRWIEPAPSRGGYVCKGQLLSPFVDKDGYLRVDLRKQGRSRIRHVAHLVLEAFVGPRPEGLQCCHYDDVSANNHLENLRWDTESANRRDGLRNGNHAQARKTHCPQNHAYTAENTYIHPSSGARACRICRAAPRRNSATATAVLA